MDGLTPDRVSTRRGWRGAGRKTGAGVRAREATDASEGATARPPQPTIPRLPQLPRVEDAAGTDGQLDAIARFARLACSGGPEAPSAEIARLRASGADAAALLLDLLVPAARHLAHRWTSDQCRYEELAVGMLHLQQALHELGADLASGGRPGPCGRRVLLVSAPAEQSMLGLYMVTEFYRCVAAELFHQAGWDVWRAPPTSRERLGALLREQWFDVVEVAATCGDRLQALGGDVTAIRRASRNARVRVVIGGPAVEALRDGDAWLGADAVAGDPRDMLGEAESLLAPTVRRRARPPR